MGKTYTGIDIGDSSIKCAVCKDGVVQNIVTEELPDGLIADGRIVSRDAMADLLKSIKRKGGGISKDVAIVLPERESLVRRLSLPAMTEKELELNLPYEFRDYISQGKDRYLYDYAVLSMTNDIDGNPETMELLAVACPKQVIDDYMEMARRAGMHLRVALPEQAALQNLIGGNPCALADCCVIDFSYSSTKLHFFLQGAYDVARTIETGGMHIDRAIAEAFGVDNHIADAYKVSDFEGCQNSEAAKNVYELIAVEINRALNFYSFNNPNSSIEVAYCCGGGSLLQPLMSAVSSHTGVQIRFISDIMPPMQGGAIDLRLLCPTAVGAAMGAR